MSASSAIALLSCCTADDTAASQSNISGCGGGDSSSVYRAFRSSAGCSGVCCNARSFVAAAFLHANFPNGDDFRRSCYRLQLLLVARLDHHLDDARIIVAGAAVPCLDVVLGTSEQLVHHA